MKASFLYVALVVVVLVTAPMVAQSATSVFVMRHCARTTPNTLGGGDPQYTYYNNYTAINWPEWPNNLPAYQCLPNGLTIVQGSGKWLAASKIPTPIAITADAVARDLETSASLVDGLGISQDAVTVNHAPFGDACPSINDTFKDAAISAHWKQFPLGPTYDKALALLQSVLGKGVAPALADIPNVVAGGYFDGGVQVGSELSERLLMELGGNMEVGWGKVSNYQQVYEMLTVHATVTHISNVVPALQKQYGASITQYVLNALDGKPGSQFFVGHDSQLWSLAATLNMEWEVPLVELSSLATLPGSMLRFDLDTASNTVTVRYLYPVFNTSTGELHEGVVKMVAADGSNTLSLDAFKALVAAGIDERCVQTS